MTAVPWMWTPGDEVQCVNPDCPSFEKPADPLKTTVNRSDVPIIGWVCFKCGRRCEVAP